MPAIHSSTLAGKLAPSSGGSPHAAGIYLSIPYCRQKCTYCNFASAARPITELPQYLQCLETEIRQCASIWERAGMPRRAPGRADTIYFGGGTPGLLTATQLGRLTHALRGTFEVDAGAEVTIEAAPENVTQENAAGWAACGVNRVSLGVQSMVTKELRAVGRMHTAATASHAVTALRSAGIANISLDLIAGLPYQTPESWEATLAEVLPLEPAHLSVYMLEVDEDSRLGGELLRGGARYSAATVPPDEVVAVLYEAAIKHLEEAGFVHYEISNFALPGRASRHNEKYWTNVPYLGFGVEAHSYDGECRWANVDSIAEYLARMAETHLPIAAWNRLRMTERLEERFFLGLRRRQGIRLSAIDAEFGPAASDRHREKIREYCDAGWMESDGESVRLTRQGVLFSNEVFAGMLEL